MSSNRTLAFACLVCLACAGPSIHPRPVHAQVREVGQLVFDGVPEVPDRIVSKMNQYQNVRSAAFSDWAPSGGLVIATRFGETYQIHHVAEPLGARKQLTFFDEPVAGASFGKESGWFLFNRDFGGNEASQMFRFDLRTGEATMLTDGEVQNGSPVWSNDRSRVAWRSTMRNATDHDVWVMDPLEPDEKKIAVQVEGYWFPSDWSPDDSMLLVGNYVSITESYFWAVDLASGKRTPVGNHGKVKGETISYGNAVFDATGKGVFFTSDEKSEFQTLRWTQLGSKKYEEITKDIPWDVRSLQISRRRDRLAFTVNDNGTDKLYVMDTATKERTEIELPLGIVDGMGFSPDGADLAFTLETTAGPADVYTVNLASLAITRWTESEVGGLDTSAFVRSELIQYPTFDKDSSGKARMIPAFIYRPEGKGPFPVIVRIHGGPESQTRAFFSYTSQYQVKELGCAVIYPNVRGSSGYGKSYLKLDNGFLREDSVKDIGALFDWIATQPDLDASRVGVTGGSYGGYMSLATLTHYSDKVRAGVDIVGISNFNTFLENTADYRRDLRRVEYGDERDSKMHAFLEKISPTNNVDKIDVPLFVIQGANDPRVPATEAAQIVEAVRAKGKEAWYMLAKDEGHGFQKKSNSNQMGYGLTMFWEKYLLGKEPEMMIEKPEEVPGASN